MHFTGMMALEVPARVTWSADLVVASVALGVAFASLALCVAALPYARGRTLAATVLLALAIAVVVAGLTCPCCCRGRCHHNRHVFRWCNRRSAREG
jgi:NO-binding membrane sensor protein with MHYT domain